MFPVELPIEVTIGAQIMQRYAVGDTIEDRFRALLVPNVQREGNWMSTDEDKCFRATVGALMLSYPPDGPEFKRIASEMNAIKKMSAIITAMQAGLDISSFNLEASEPPIGLLGLWRGRVRA